MLDHNIDAQASSAASLYVDLMVKIGTIPPTRESA